MSEIRIPEKTRILNRPTKYPATFTDAAGGVVAAASAVQVAIQGFGKIKTSQIKNVVAVRGLEPSYNVVDFTFVAADAGTPTNTPLYFEYSIETTNRDFRLARPEYEFGQTQRHSILIGASETATSIVTKLIADINAGSHREREFIIVASEPSAGVLRLTVQSPYRGVFVDTSSAAVKGEDNLTSLYLALPTAAVTVQSNKGIGYGSDVEFREKLQYKNNVPYGYDFEEIPVEDQLYTYFGIDLQVSRQDPKSSVLSDTVRMELYVNEATGSAYIDALADFLLTGMATRLTAANATAMKVGFNDAAALTNTNALTDDATGQYDSDFTSLTPIIGALAGTDPKYIIAESVALEDLSSNGLLTRFKTNA